MFINHYITIKIYAGTYDEDVLTENQMGAGYLNIINNEDDEVNIKSISVHYCSKSLRIIIDDFTLTTTSQTAASIIKSACDLGRLVITASSTKRAIRYNESIGTISYCTCSNHSYGIDIVNNSDVTLDGTDGTGNDIGVNAYNSIIHIGSGGNTTTGTTPIENIGSAIILFSGLGTWADWTPNPSNLNIGTTGTLIAQRSTDGKRAHIHFEATLDGTGISVGDVSFTLPATSLYNKQLIGEAYDATGSRYPILGYIAAGSATCVIRVCNAAGTYLVGNGAALSSSVPFTWAANDRIMIDGEYITE
jgi:hypothetical protein